MSRRLIAVAALVLAIVQGPVRAHAGVTHPDLSVPGKPFARWTDDPSDSSAKRARLELKGGKCRAGFGKLNPMHHGQQHMMRIGSGNSAEMAEGSPVLLFLTVSEIQRLPVLREAGSLRPCLDQEAQCS